MSEEQTVREGNEASAFTIGKYTFQDPVALTTSFKGVLLIDARKIRQSVIQFYNVDATETIEYKIFATAKYDTKLISTDVRNRPSQVDIDADKNWVNLLSIIAGQTGTTYDHTTSKTIGPLKRFYESFTNEWFSVLVQAKTVNGTADLQIWHRGQS